MPSNDHDLQSPTENALISPGDEPEDSKVKLKKDIGLLEGVAIVLGIMLGSGKSLI